MQIEHDPEENRKLPGHNMERRWAREKFGENPSPSDLLWYIAPIAAVVVAMHIWRGY